MDALLQKLPSFVSQDLTENWTVTIPLCTSLNILGCLTCMNVASTMLLDVLEEINS